MGLSASQSRLMSITARLSDLELQAQTISNSKVRLSDLSAAASENYTRALDKQLLTIKNPSTSGAGTQHATLSNLTTYGAISDMDKQRFVKDSAGRVVVNTATATAYQNAGGNVNTFLATMGVVTATADPNYDSGAVTSYTNIFNEIRDSGAISVTDEQYNDPEWLQASIDAGNIFLYTKDTQQSSTTFGDFINVSWTSGDSTLAEADDNRGQAKAEAEYESTMASIQSKDKRFDLALKTIDTEHSAAQTEIDSVQKVISKNIERSFKIFNG